MELDQKDVHLALDLAAFLCADAERLVHLTVPGPPKAKARPRIGKHGGYAPDRDSQQLLAWQIKSRVGNVMFDAGVAVGAIFFRPNRQRIDVDNMLKFVLDAATGVIWKDDSQVAAVAGFVAYDKENPRTILVFGDRRFELRELPTTICEWCDEPFRRFISEGSKQRRFCSQECRSRGTHGGVLLKAPVACPQCEMEFARRTTSQKFCSAPCARASTKGKSRPTGEPLPKCADCGGELSKPGYVRCRSCWKEARKHNEA